MADAADEDDCTELDRIADNFKALTDPADDLRRSDLEAAISERRLQLNHASDMWAAGTIDVEQFTKLSHDGKLQIEAWQAELSLPCPRVEAPRTSPLTLGYGWNSLEKEP